MNPKLHPALMGWSSSTGRLACWCAKDWLSFLPCLSSIYLTQLPGVNSQINYLHSNPCLVIDFWGTQTKKATVTLILLLRPPQLWLDLNQIPILPSLSWVSSYDPLWSSLKIGLSRASSGFPTGFYLFWNPQGVWSGSHFLLPQEAPYCLNKYAGKSMGALARAGLKHLSPTTPAQ